MGIIKYHACEWSRQYAWSYMYVGYKLQVHLNLHIIIYGLDLYTCVYIIYIYMCVCEYHQPLLYYPILATRIYHMMIWPVAGIFRSATLPAHPLRNERCKSHPPGELENRHLWRGCKPAKKRREAPKQKNKDFSRKILDYQKTVVVGKSWRCQQQSTRVFQCISPTNRLFSPFQKINNFAIHIAFTQKELQVLFFEHDLSQNMITRLHAGCPRLTNPSWSTAQEQIRNLNFRKSQHLPTSLYATTFVCSIILKTYHVVDTSALVKILNQTPASSLETIIFQCIFSLVEWSGKKRRVSYSRFINVYIYIRMYIYICYYIIIYT